MTRSIGILAFGLLIAALTAPADESVLSLVALVRDGVQNHQPDSVIAKAVAKFKPNARVDHRLVEELQSEGAGRETVDQLEHLVEITAARRASDAPLPFDEPPTPSPSAVRSAIEAARAYAANYSKGLPDFLCRETIQRYEGATDHGPWFSKDRLTLQVSYANQAEDYKLLLVNGRPTTEDIWSQLGALTEGEFGSLMMQILSPSNSEIRWDHWTHLRGRLTQVFAFAISPAHSSYQLEFGYNGERFAATPGQAGLIYVDPESQAVVRFTRAAANLPAKFPVKLATTALDYAFAEIGARQYLLPLHAAIRMSAREFHTRNEVDFDGYRKFSSDATISFGDPAPPIRH